jgi:uncharacterized protein YdeI (YjbR/CyaY-like superfamily)
LTELHLTTTLEPRGPAAAIVLSDEQVAVLGDAKAFPAAGLRAAFDALAPSRRKEHARSVADAKGDDTRARRVQKVLDALSG